MRPRTLMLVGLGVGATAYIVLSGRANKVANWGRKQRVTGGGKYVLGKLKERFGRVVGSKSIVSEGVVNQIEGAAKVAAGRVAGSVGRAIHQMNL